MRLHRAFDLGISQNRRLNSGEMPFRLKHARLLHI